MAIPVHTWVWVTAPSGENYLGFTYLDRTAGLSVKAGPWPEPQTAEALDAAIHRPGVTFRLPGPWNLTPVSPGDIAALKLPAEPPWLAHFAPPPPASQPWRTDLLLAGKFHPSYPDDLEALFFFHAHRRVERMWVRIVDVAASSGGYLGQLLNTPHTPAGLQAGAPVVIRAARGAPSPIWVRDAVRDNLSGYQSLCHDCGFDLLVTPAAELVQRQFPGAPEGSVMMQFTTRCAMCQGTMTVEARQ
jgi:hypothetical protein